MHRYHPAATLTLSLILTACGGGSTPTPGDGLSAEQRTTLQAAPALNAATPPDGAQTVDAATLADLISSGQFRFVTPQEQAELAQADAAAPDRVQAWKTEIGRAAPALLASLGDLGGEPGDTTSIPMPGEGALGTVRVNRPVTELAGYVAAVRALADVGVQRPSYAADYQQLKDAAQRSGVDLSPYGLTDPQRLTTAPLGDVQAARARLETAMQRVGSSLKSPSRALTGLTRQTIDNPTEEEGAINIFGKGYYDRAGSKTRCEGWSATGLYHYAGFLPSAQRWTAVKAQGNRGTCWAFAITAYMEDLKAQATGKRWNFSEQAATAFLKYDVRGQDKAILGKVASDGEDTIAAFQTFFDRKYSPVLETSWYYNGGWQWPAAPEGQKQTYAGVCTGYDATFAKVFGKFQKWCSATSHEYPVVCATFFGVYGCGVVNIAGNTNLYAAQTLNWKTKADVWYRPNSSAADAATRIVNYAMGSWTEPVVISVDSRYLQPDASGFVGDLAVNPDIDAPYSNHAVVLVDYLTEAETRQYLPQSRWTTGGYLVIRNSWGDCWGDSGFAYVPMNWAKKYTFKYARAVN
ncbi:C1 family peptidase [Deinococcus yunweiensis]|uniref:C1 family peptidase n=1 Tax=Deinococcus yunweiensis TaxID=367282 RepID=UPI00398EBDA8